MYSVRVARVLPRILLLCSPTIGCDAIAGNRRSGRPRRPRPLLPLQHPLQTSCVPPNTCESHAAKATWHSSVIGAVDNPGIGGFESFLEFRNAIAVSASAKQ